MGWLAVVLPDSGAQPEARTPSNCTMVGGPNRDVLSGSDGKDIICAEQGDDYLAGGPKGDKLLGGTGRDTSVGGPGPDKLKGGKGSDRLFAVDNHPTDVIRGGNAIDRCYGDRGDTFRGCEEKFIGGTIQAATALSSAFFGQGELAEELIAGPPPLVTVTQTITETVTHTASFPPCTPPPTKPPSPC